MFMHFSKIYFESSLGYLRELFELRILFKATCLRKQILCNGYVIILTAVVYLKVIS
jgi:hypothetical protein